MAEAVNELMKVKDAGSKLSEELNAAVEWFAGFFVMTTRIEDDPAPPTHDLAFMDRFFRTEKLPGTEKTHGYFLSANDVNEGVIYQLFLAVLCLHPAAPSLFAVDNGDHGLNRMALS